MRGLHHPSTNDIDLLAVLNALADPIRLNIVVRLADRAEHPCTGFDLGITAASMSHHFRVLREAGISATRQDGKHRWLTLRRADLDTRFPGLLDSLLTAAANRKENTR
ncbi:ArsR/SmtB family transcription factor [Nocardia stercoris]|uniref:Transcriptional regulator n=1 Tax=Nocardia stercoris TaxID=2483361 RepID=A0A3M2KT24_9NOCA|nr:helix-turn-helix domain-containing protein [Nocardia stercoris]RMI27816.1 transcriptional regulator [Nocardia stercoris]